MDKKLLWLILFLIAIVAFVRIGAYLVFGALTVTLETPTANGTEYYNSCPFQVNVSSNSTYGGFGYKFFNISVWSNSTSNFTYTGNTIFKAMYTNGSAYGYAWNSSALCWDAQGSTSGSVIGPAPFYLPERWMQIIVNETTNASTGPPVQNYTTVNTSIKGGTLFYINERAPGTVSITPYRGMDGLFTIANNSYFAYGGLNISIVTDKTIAYCQWYNETNSSLVGIIADGVSMTPANSSSRTSFANYTYLEWNNTDFNGTSHRMTWMCQDAFGNKSWYNTSATGGFLNFKVDTTAPALNGTTYKILNSTTWVENNTYTEELYFSANASYAALTYGNAWSILVVANVSTNFGTTNFAISADKTKIQLTQNSTNPVVTPVTLNVTYSYRGKSVVSTTQGNYINYTFEVTDNNTNSAWVKIFKSDGTAITLGATKKSSALGGGIKKAVYYEVNITPQYLDKNGIFRLQPMANDLAGNQGNGTNISVMISNLLINKWNSVVFYENTTLGNISGRVLNISYVSIFSNKFGYKNFTTYQVGLATSGAVRINQSDAVLIYPNENVVLINRIYNETSDIFPNVNLTTGGWNFIAMDANYNATAWNELLGQRRFNLNESMFADACTNKTYQSFGTNTSLYYSTNETILFNNNTWYPVGNPKIASLLSVGNESMEIYPWNGTVIANWNSTHIKLYDQQISGGVIAWGKPYNISYTWTENYATSNCGNITFTSYYNATSGKWCSSKRGMGVNSCSGFTATNTYPPLSQGFWILTNVNMTFNREAIGWYDARAS